MTNKELEGALFKNDKKTISMHIPGHRWAILIRKKREQNAHPR